MPEEEVKLADVLVQLNDRLQEEQKTVQHSVLSTEKIVAAVVLLVVTSVCVWVGSTLSGMQTSVIKLEQTVGHQAEAIKTLNAEVRELRNGPQSNTAAIQLLQERMRLDEVRRNEIIKDLQSRVADLENGK